MDVVMSMNAVFSCFDALMDRYNVYKVRKLLDMPKATKNVDCNSTGIAVLRIHSGWGNINKDVSSSFGASQIKDAEMLLLSLHAHLYLSARNKPVPNRTASGNQNTWYTHGGELGTHKNFSQL